MNVSLATLLVRPRAAFEAAEEPLSLARVVSFVLVVGCVSLVTAFPLYINTQRQPPADIATIEFVVGDQTGTIPVWFAVGILSGIVLIFLFWVLTAALIHVVARAAGGEGRFRRIFVYTGWCHTPHLVFYPLIALVALWLVVTAPDRTLSVVLHGTSQFSEGSLVTFNGQGLVDARSWYSYVGTVWIGYLWAGAIEVAYDLSRRRSLAVAGVVTALSLLLTQLG